MKVDWVISSVINHRIKYTFFRLHNAIKSLDSAIRRLTYTHTNTHTERIIDQTPPAQLGSTVGLRMADSSGHVNFSDTVSLWRCTLDWCTQRSVCVCVWVGGVSGESFVFLCVWMLDGIFVNSYLCVSAGALHVHWCLQKICKICYSLLNCLDLFVHITLLDNPS